MVLVIFTFYEMINFEIKTFVNLLIDFSPAKKGGLSQERHALVMPYSTNVFNLDSRTYW